MASDAAGSSSWLPNKQPRNWFFDVDADEAFDGDDDEYPHVVRLAHRHGSSHDNASPVADLGGDISLASTLENGVVLAPSRIPGGGQGVFATRRFLPGQVVSEYSGDIVFEDSPQLQENAAYLIGLTCPGRAAGSRRPQHQPVLLDAAYVPRLPGTPAAHWVNDARNSKHYNTFFVETLDPALRGCMRRRMVPFQVCSRVWLVASKLIEPGDELFVDYGDPYWEGHFLETGDEPYVLP